MFYFLLVTSCLLLLFYFCCFTTTITTIITTTTITVSQLLLIPLCKQVFISDAVELATQLSKPVRILCVPKCRINKLGYLAREDYLDPLKLRVINKNRCFPPGCNITSPGLMFMSLKLVIRGHEPTIMHKA